MFTQVFKRNGVSGNCSRVFTLWWESLLAFFTSTSQSTEKQISCFLGVHCDFIITRLYLLNCFFWNTKPSIIINEYPIKIINCWCFIANIWEKLCYLIRIYKYPIQNLQIPNQFSLSMVLKCLILRKTFLGKSFVFSGIKRYEIFKRVT